MKCDLILDPEHEYAKSSPLHSDNQLQLEPVRPRYEEVFVQEGNPVASTSVHMVRPIISGGIFSGKGNHP